MQGFKLRKLERMWHHYCTNVSNTALARRQASLHHAILHRSTQCISDRADFARKRGVVLIANYIDQERPELVVDFEPTRLDDVVVPRVGDPPGGSVHGERANFTGLVLGCIDADFASKYAFDSIFQALQDLHTFAPLQSQNFRACKVCPLSVYRSPRWFWRL